MNMAQAQGIKSDSAKKLLGVRRGFPAYLLKESPKLWDLPNPVALNIADIFLVSKCDPRNPLSYMLSYMVCAVTDSPFSHSAIYVGNTRNDGNRIMEKLVAKTKETEKSDMFFLSKQIKISRLKRLLNRMEGWMKTGERIHILEEANTNGVELVNAAVYYDSKNYGGIVKRIKNISQMDGKEIADNAMSQLGEEYDYVQFASLGYLYLAGRRKTTEAVDLKWSVCSEVIVKAAAKKGIFFSNEIPLANITPADIDKSQTVETVPGMRKRQA